MLPQSTVASIRTSNKEIHKKIIQQEKIPMKKSNEKQKNLFLPLKMLPYSALLTSDRPINRYIRQKGIKFKDISDNMRVQ